VARALIALGSNLGERRRALDDAVAAIGGFPQTRLFARSSLYETVPVGGPPGQEPFVNGAIVVETALAPLQLLDELLQLETKLGRVRDVPWGPRTIDLDLLLYDDAVIETERLRVPHPRFSFRKFVLRGAVEIAGAWRHPLLDRTLGELWTHLETTPRYAAFVGRSQGFRSQFAAEAADAARARLIDATDAGVPASVEQLTSHGLAKGAAIEFLDARAAAVRRSLADTGDSWIIDDAWLAAEAAELCEQLGDDAGFRGEAQRRLALDVTPRLILSLDPIDSLEQLHRTVPDLITLPPVVFIHIADREAALIEIAAALEAAA
jgi:2-amino-4-hydroxy-6-hydroxymethyldihydropteridine diphosphokinase